MSKKPVNRKIPEPPQLTFAGHFSSLMRLIKHRYFQSELNFEGSPEEICQQILEKLWRKKFYATGLSHFTYLWIRDFGTVSSSLIELGHRDRVHSTLHWALHQYRRGGKVTLCIDRFGQIFNIPEQSIDALPWLLHAIFVSDYPLDDEEKVFLEEQLIKYRQTFLDAHGMLKLGHYAELRDAVLYKQSAYALSLVARLATVVAELGLAGFPFPAEQYRHRLLERYWAEEYFRADLATQAFSAESALMPFVLGVIDDKDLMNKTFNYILEAGLNKPFSLKYTSQPRAFSYRIWAKTVMRNYAGTTIWTWHGAFFVQLLKKFDHPAYAEELGRLEKMIEQHQTFPELLHPDGSLYKTLIYKSDEAMIWCALYLATIKKK